VSQFSYAKPQAVRSISSISDEVARLAIPAIAQLLLQSFVFLLDRIMLGHYSTTALASMRMSSSLHWCIFSTFSAASVGAIALMGRAVGGKKPAFASAVVRSCWLFSLILGMAIAVISWLALDDVIGWLHLSNPDLQIAAKGYLRIVLSAMPLQLAAIMSAALLQASGNTKTPFFVGAIANGVNFGVNYCLIFGHFGLPELGVRGAAVGTVGAIAINAIVLSGILYRGFQGISLQRSRGGELIALGRVLRLSIPVFSERLFRSFGYLGFTAILATLGDVAIATYEVTESIELIQYQIAEGFGIATAAIVSQQLGGKSPQTAAIAGRVATGLAVAVLTVGSLMFLLFPQWILEVFSSDPDIITAGVPCLVVVAIAQPFMATSIVLEQVLRSAGDTRTAFYISLAGWLVVRMIATYLFVFVFDFGLIGVWMGSTCDWILRCIVLLYVFFRGRWQKIAL
jgi:putative MATE family efflux protein